MSMDPAVSFEDLEQRRRRTSAARKPSHVPQPLLETDSEAMAVINEIFNPTLKLPESTGHYKLPDEMRADDVDALKDLDISKLAELKEVFLLFDIDSDGLISKNDLRFTFTALGGDVTDETLDEMLKEAKDPLDYDAFVDLMSRRTVELDPEDVLLEAWSKWDDYGTGKIDEKNCFDYIEIFPYLREPVIENSTNPEYVVCNRSSTMTVSVTNVTASAAATTATTLLPDIVANNSSNAAIANDLRLRDTTTTTAMSTTTTATSMSTLTSTNEFIYSAGKVFGIRLRFRKPQQKNDVNDWILNISGDYRFMKKDNFKNDGRIIPGSYCDYYFFADTNAATSKNLEIWKYFHSPRFPAKYPAHIKCAYKFIGRPESRVEIVFEELHISKQGKSCNMDKLTIFDSESANMNAVIDVVCDALPTRRIISSGPDLLIEFNVSSNVTGKGFRGKFKFLHNEIEQNYLTTTTSTTEAVIAGEKLVAKKQTISYNLDELRKVFKNNGE